MRHIKRYEECEHHVYSAPIKLRHPVFEREDDVPYPREEDEDRSYEVAFRESMLAMERRFS